MRARGRGPSGGLATPGRVNNVALKNVAGVCSRRRDLCVA